MKTFQRYQEYKPSGIDWIEEIPKHWEMTKVKFLCENILGGGTPTTSISDFWADNLENGILWVSIGDITKSSFIRDTERYISHLGLKNSSAQLVPPFSILYSIYASLGKVAYSDKTLSTNQAILSIIPAEEKSFFKFLFYLLLSLQDKISILSTATTQNNISLDILKNIKLPLAPLEEQKSIANFLDQKSKQIDEFIADKQALIALFEEQKTAIINDAVTKGLDKTTPLIPSGIEWIDEIPSHWLMRKVSRSFSTIGSGTTPSSGNDTYYKDGDILWVNSGDLNNSYLYDTEKKVTPLALKDFSALKLFQKNSLIIAMYGATIGKLALLESIACVNQACCVLNDSEYFEIKFVFYWFLANKQNIVNLSFGGGQPNISQDVIKSLKIQAPPLEEQKQIIAYLETELAKIDTLIETAKAEITLIEEYKTSLINEAVTGKIKIHDGDAT